MDPQPFHANDWAAGGPRQSFSCSAPTWALYQAASERAQRDFELNQLFNPEFYGLQLPSTDESEDVIDG